MSKEPHERANRVKEPNATRPKSLQEKRTFCECVCAYSRVDVCGTFHIWLREHGEDGQEDLLHGLDGRPALGGALVLIGVIAGRMEDGDAHFPIRIDWGGRHDEMVVYIVLYVLVCVCVWMLLCVNLFPVVLFYFIYKGKDV